MWFPLSSIHFLICSTVNLFSYCNQFPTTQSAPVLTTRLPLVLLGLCTHWHLPGGKGWKVWGKKGGKRKERSGEGKNPREYLIIHRAPADGVFRTQLNVTWSIFTGSQLTSTTHWQLTSLKKVKKNKSQSHFPQKTLSAFLFYWSWYLVIRVIRKSGIKTGCKCLGKGSSHHKKQAVLPNKLQPTNLVFLNGINSCDMGINCHNVGILLLNFSKQMSPDVWKTK